MTVKPTIMVLGGIVAGIIVGLLVGFFFGRGRKFQTTVDDSSPSLGVKQQYHNSWAENSCLFPESETDWKKTLLKHVSSSKIQEYSKELTRRPHLAGSERDSELARYIQDSFLKFGFDDATLVPYNVLISVPDKLHPNKVRLLDDTDREILVASHREKPMRAEDDAPDFIDAFNAYAPKARVSGELVYVNYARVEDFDELEKLGISVMGKISIARYGKIFRGNKVQNAQKHGAIGMILYLDPIEVALEGVDVENVYPNKWWMPGTGIQRGTIRMSDGDPATPGWPSIDGGYRNTLEETIQSLPLIPSQPIGYEDAKKFLELMTGPLPPTNWTGGISGVEYRLGPGFQGINREYKVELEVNNVLKNITSFNVIGRINGSLEPDRYVFLGNHRDAWGFGSVDPSSGTAGLLETARVFGLMKQNGCRPRRTLIFGSWGAEEVGIIGSTEWVEENIFQIRERAVAYVNTDICTTGPVFSPEASPLLRDAVISVLHKIPSPLNNAKTLYDSWIEDGTRNGTYPKVGLLGSGSDHSPFAFHAGISAVDFWFKFDKRKYPISMYPAYHTGYETYYLMSEIIDPGFKIHRGCSLFALALMTSLSDTHLLPFNITRYAEEIENSIQEFRKGKNYGILEDYDAVQGFDLLTGAVSEFKEAAKNWHASVRRMNIKDPVIIRRLNDRLMSIEKSFILLEGLPNRPHTKHAIFAPSAHDSYSSAGFPGLSDLLYDANQLQSTEKEERKRKLLRHMTDLLVLTRQATKLVGNEAVI